MVDEVGAAPDSVDSFAPSRAIQGKSEVGSALAQGYWGIPGSTQEHHHLGELTGQTQSYLAKWPTTPPRMRANYGLDFSGVAP